MDTKRILAATYEVKGYIKTIMFDDSYTKQEIVDILENDWEHKPIELVEIKEVYYTIK